MLKIMKQYWEWSAQAICFAIVMVGIILALNMVAGCGHNIYVEKEITGLGVDVPMGESNLGIVIGCNKTVRATVRGGASFETSSSNGGGVFSGEGGQSKITQFKSHAQLNEGNLVDVLTSPECPAEAKIIIASNLVHGVNAPYFPGSILQTKESTIHIGRAAIQSNDVEQFQSTDPQGINKLIDSTQKIIGTNIVNSTINTVGQVTHDVVNPLEGTVTKVEDTVEKVDETLDGVGETLKSVMHMLLWVVIGLAAVLIFSMIRNRNKNHKCNCIVVDKNPEDATADAMTTAECEQVLDAEFTEKPPKLQPPKRVAKESPQEVKPGWFKRFCAGVVKYTKVLIGWIKLIPPEYRKQIMNTIIDYCKQKKAERDKAKLEAEKQQKSKKKK